MTPAHRRSLSLMSRMHLDEGNSEYIKCFACPTSISEVVTSVSGRRLTAFQAEQRLIAGVQSTISIRFQLGVGVAAWRCIGKRKYVTRVLDVKAFSSSARISGRTSLLANRLEQMSIVACLQGGLTT